MKRITNQSSRTLPINLRTEFHETPGGGSQTNYRSLNLLPFGHKNEKGERDDQADVKDDDITMPDVEGLLASRALTVEDLPIQS